MAILVANIGTSDVSIAVGDYYLPIGFERIEPNLQLPERDDLKQLWNQRTEKVRAIAQSELDIDLSGKDDRAWFRQVSEKLWERYQQTPEVWHDRIQMGRLLGVIETARQAGSLPLHIHLVVTDQPQSETQGHPSDTVHIFDIIQCWLKRQFPQWMTDANPELHLIREAITFKAVDQDRLFDYYDRLLNQFDPDETVYVSVKGGTPQMQTALKIQAIAAAGKAPIFVEPKPDVARILEGKPSKCDRVAYWRYQQSQTYRSVRQLLTRWDFDGAATLLEEWDQTSKKLIDIKVKDERQKLKQHQRQVQQVLAGMRIAVDCLNLDLDTARKASSQSLKLAEALKLADQMPFKAALDHYDLLKNLYAQCQIYQELNQIANFLARMGSFYEATQKRLIQHLHGENYTQGITLLTGKFEEERPQAWEEFLKIHWNLIQERRWEDDRFKPGRRWFHDRSLNLGNRFIKRSFIKALIADRYQNRYSDRPSLVPWEKLDFWYEQRNDIIHSSEGVSVERVKALTQRQTTACAYDQILTVMAQIMSMLKLELLEGEVYLYGSIREWAIAQLMAK
jgi:hypothetical protein